MVIDQDIFLSLKNLLKDKTVELIGQYLATSGQFMVEIEAAVESKDGKKLHYAAHTIKSSSEQIGATPLAKLLLELEKCGKEENFDNASKLLPQAKIAYGQVRGVLEQQT